MSTPVVEFGDPCLMVLVGASVALATWQGHGKAWREWCMLCKGGMLMSDRASLLEVTLNYLMQLQERELLAAVAQRRLTGVRFHLLLRGQEDVTRDFIIRQSLKGWKKERTRSECRRPVSYASLLHLMDSLQGVCSSEYEACLFRICFCVAFFGVLLVGELILPSCHKLGGLFQEDVVVANSMV